MVNPIFAGHLKTCELQDSSFGYVNAVGLLSKDYRKESADGTPRDFSRSRIYTSGVSRLEYLADIKRTEIITRNSVYFTDGNLIKTHLGSSKEVIEGPTEIMRLFNEAKDLHPAVYGVLQKSGADMSGWKEGSIVMVVRLFCDHFLCGEDETPYCLIGDYKGDDTILNEIVFLKEDDVITISEERIIQ